MTTAKARRFPQVPKSTAALIPGDFWGVPLSDGRWACGRVLQHIPKGRPGARVGFLGGLLDWTGSEAPTAESIAGRPLLEQGVMHVLSITTTGGAVLGNRALELDGIEPLVVYHDGMICRGFTPLRPWVRADAQTIPSLGYWSYDVLQIRANVLLVKPSA